MSTTILVTREIVVEDLRHFGYEVTAASDGREAFELVRTGMYRLVVSDWQMPHMSGLDLCREIRKRGWSGYIYFILLTLRGGVDNVVCGLDAGADDFLTKPFQPQELRMRLRTGERVLGLESRDLMIFAMAKLAESRDKDTGAHLERMREYSRHPGRRTVAAGRSTANPSTATTCSSSIKPARCTTSARSACPIRCC